MTLPTTTGLAPALDLPVVDVQGHQLRLVLGRTPATVVAEQSWILADGTALTAEVLAASHRVSIVGPGVEVVETVACDVGGPAPVDARRLPGRHRCTAQGRTLSFTSRFVRGADAVDALARRLHARSGRADTLSVNFPGHPDALTAIEITATSAPGSVGWSTWHLYPGVDPHAVLTVTVVEASPSPDPAPIRR